MKYSVFYRLLCAFLIFSIPVQSTIAFARGNEEGSVEPIQKEKGRDSRKDKDREKDQALESASDRSEADLENGEVDKNFAPVDSEVGAARKEHQTQALAILNELFPGLQQALAPEALESQRVDWEKVHKVFRYLENKIRPNPQNARWNSANGDPELILVDQILLKMAKISDLRGRLNQNGAPSQTPYTNVCSAGSCIDLNDDCLSCYEPPCGKAAGASGYFVYHAGLLFLQAFSLIPMAACAGRVKCGNDMYEIWSGNRDWCVLKPQYNASLYEYSYKSTSYTSQSCLWVYGMVELGVLGGVHILPYVVWYAPWVVGNSLGGLWKLGAMGCAGIYNGCVGLKNLAAGGYSGLTTWISKTYTESQIASAEKQLMKDLELLQNETGFHQLVQAMGLTPHGGNIPAAAGVRGAQP
jgi:hypothetical protein